MTTQIWYAVCQSLTFLRPLTSFIWHLSYWNLSVPTSLQWKESHFISCAFSSFRSSFRMSDWPCDEQSLFHPRWLTKFGMRPKILQAFHRGTSWLSGVTPPGVDTSFLWSRTNSAEVSGCPEYKTVWVSWQQKKKMLRNGGCDTKACSITRDPTPCQPSDWTLCCHLARPSLSGLSCPLKAEELWTLQACCTSHLHIY